jgi:large conductance mechanosensitive channel
VLREFRAFIARGNVLDLAVAVIIGGAFGKIITSLVNDMLMPVIGLILGRISFANLFVALNGREYASIEAAKADGAATLNIGLFVNSVIDFLIVAFVIFLAVKGANSLQRKKEDAPAVPPEPPADVKLLGEIRDLLKTR